MTTTTRTTRKAPWAVFLTALLAALAMVLGSLMIAAPANAKDNPKPENPGNSATAPGHQDGTTVPPGHDPEFVPPGQEGRPETDKKVWVCHADTNNGNGNHDLGHEVNGQGTGGQLKTGFNILYISTSAWENGHEGRHPSDRHFTSEAEAFAYCGVATPPTYTCPDGTTSLSHPYTTEDDGICYPPKSTTVPVEYCAALIGSDSYSLVTFTGVQGTDESGWLNGTTPKSAYKIDDSRVQCINADQAAAIEAAVAATAPLPATVAAPAPASIKVPAKGPTIPATVPAGDGSTAPTTPVAALTFLVLAATALAASTVRLVGAKR